MTGLDEALMTLLKEALPDLLGGAAPAVALSVTATEFVVDPQSQESIPSEPRPDDRTDQFPWDADNPAGPYTLSQSPYPVPRRVYLQQVASDRIPLRQDEVQWDATDSRKFLLNLRPSREVNEVSGVRVLYGVTAVFTRLKATQTFTVQLAATDTAQLAKAEALAIAILELNRQRLTDDARSTYRGGDYGAESEVKTLRLTRGAQSPDGKRLLTLVAEIELKVTRALGADEGAPIQRILSPGRAGSTQHPVDINIGVEA